MLGWALFVPVGFVLDPVFDRIGSSLLQAVSLRPLWTSWFNMPLMPYTNFNNTIVLGSVVAWLVLAVPIYFAAKYGVARYRATLGVRVRGCAGARVAFLTRRWTSAPCRWLIRSIRGRT